MEPLDPNIPESNNELGESTNLGAEGHTESVFENRIDIDDLGRGIERIRKEIAKVVIGQSQMIDLLIICLLTEGHALIEGVPGVAKTLTAKLMARTVATNFSRIQFTPDLMPSDVLGTSVFNFQSSEFDFKKGPIFSNMVLIDEINRAPAKTQAALFEVMEERQITIDGLQFKMEPPFMVLATQNPIEQEGTYRLPEAQLDRFLFKINVGYPSVEEEAQIIQAFHDSGNRNLLEEVQAVVTPEELRTFKEKVRAIRIEKDLIRYIAEGVQMTRENKSLYLGASPRASLALMISSKAYAAMQGRDFVTPEDIKFVAKPVLRHRVILSPELEMEGVSADKVIDTLLSRVEIPR